MRRVVATAAALAAAAVLAGGCGTVVDIDRGGTVAGTTLSVYSLLPQPGRGASRDMVDAQKLALLDARGVAGPYTINFIALDEGPPGGRSGARDAAVDLRDALADPQVAALIGPAGSDTALATVPLFNAAGILEVVPGAGYPGFTEAVGAGEPERWQPSGRRTLARLVGDDLAQARSIVAAAAAATGRARPRIAAEQEPGAVADALVEGLHEAGARLVGSPERADAVVYAGEDPENAAGVADALAGEAPDAAIVLPDALTRAGIAERLTPAARRRAVFVSSAPVPGSTPALRAFERRFREQFGREPDRYAPIGYESMRSVLAAMADAGERASKRQAIIDAYFDPDEARDSLLGLYRIGDHGQRVPAPFTAFRLGADGRARYLRL